MSLEQAGTEIDALATRIDRLNPSAVAARGAGVAPLRDQIFGPPLRRMLVVLLGAVGFVLLIACVNVAGLLLARGTARQGELAMRCALGATRGRIVRQLLTESLVLSAVGGAAGLMTAGWSVDVLLALSPVSFPEFVRVGIDGRVLAFTFAVCVGGGLLFGLVPAFSASRAGLAAAMNLAGRDGGTSSTLLRRSLVTAEVALAAVLLVGAGLMLRTLDQLRAVDPGFRPQGLVTLRLTLPLDPSAGAPAPERIAAFARALVEEVRGVPGVVNASLSSDVPLGTSTSATSVRIAGRDDESIRVYRHAVSPGHFRTIGTPLLEGRDFNDNDRLTDGTRAAIVSRAMATRHWPAGDALRQQFRMNDRLHEVVGVVGDLQHRQLLEADSADPDVFIPLYQAPQFFFAVIARTAGAIDPVIAGVRQAVRKLDPAVPVFQVETGEQLIRRQTAAARFSGALLAAFAVVALALTMIGIYGVTAYTVSRQTRQVGIRIALGATPGEVLRLVLSGGAAFIAAGIVLGTLGALVLTRLLESWVYGVSATDPFTFGSVIALLSLVALLACLIPAMKATRIDPLAALRSE